jgi:hypothetical protein
LQYAFVKKPKKTQEKKPLGFLGFGGFFSDVISSHATWMYCVKKKKKRKKKNVGLNQWFFHANPEN